MFLTIFVRGRKGRLPLEISIMYPRTREYSQEPLTDGNVASALDNIPADSTTRLP